MAIIECLAPDHVIWLDLPATATKPCLFNVHKLMINPDATGHVQWTITRAAQLHNDKSLFRDYHDALDKLKLLSSPHSPKRVTIRCKPLRGPEPHFSYSVQLTVCTQTVHHISQDIDNILYFKDCYRVVTAPTVDDAVAKTKSVWDHYRRKLHGTVGSA